MKLFIIHTLAFAMSLLSFADAVMKPNFGLRCAPYCSGGTVRQGARGPCINTCFAVTCRGKPGILTYQPSLIDANRRRSGCAAQSTSPCSRLAYGASGDSCDEYPLSSTAEGGTGSILRCVPGEENSSQGGQFNAYVRANAVGSGDTFRQTVVVVPGSLPYCPNSQSCTNDGYEFLYNGNGIFANARRASEAEHDAGFVIAPDGTEVAPLPVFRTSGGHLVTFLDNEETPFNSTVWIDGDDGGQHTIVKQLNAQELRDLAAATVVEERQSC